MLYPLQGNGVAKEAMIQTICQSTDNSLLDDNRIILCLEMSLPPTTTFDSVSTTCSHLALILTLTLLSVFLLPSPAYFHPPLSHPSHHHTCLLHP